MVDTSIHSQADPLGTLYAEVGQLVWQLLKILPAFRFTVRPLSGVELRVQVMNLSVKASKVSLLGLTSLNATTASEKMEVIKQVPIGRLEGTLLL